jgi:hypothetical protein
MNAALSAFLSLKNRGALVSRLASCFVHTEKRENFQLKAFFHLLAINFSRSTLVAGQCQLLRSNLLPCHQFPSLLFALMIYRKQKKIVFDAFQRIVRANSAEAKQIKTRNEEGKL